MCNSTRWFPAKACSCGPSMSPAWTSNAPYKAAGEELNWSDSLYSPEQANSLIAHHRQQKLPVSCLPVSRLWQKKNTNLSHRDLCCFTQVQWDFHLVGAEVRDLLLYCSEEKILELFSKIWKKSGRCWVENFAWSPLSLQKAIKWKKNPEKTLDENWIKLPECLRNSLGFFLKSCCDSMRMKADRM